MSKNAENTHHFIPPVKYYVVTLIALLLLTGLTLYTALQVDLGDLNLALAMVIASVKAFFVIAFFMGLWWDTGFSRIILGASIFFFFLFLSITWLDIANRDLVHTGEAELIDTPTPVETRDAPTLPEVEELLKR